MSSLGRLFVTQFGPNLFKASILQAMLTSTGVFTFIAGVLYLPTLAPTRIEMILCLLLLAAIALLCTTVGLLAVIVEAIGKRGVVEKRP